MVDVKLVGGFHPPASTRMTKNGSARGLGKIQQSNLQDNVPTFEAFDLAREGFGLNPTNFHSVFTVLYNFAVLYNFKYRNQILLGRIGRIARQSSEQNRRFLRLCGILVGLSYNYCRIHNLSTRQPHVACLILEK